MKARLADLGLRISPDIRPSFSFAGTSKKYEVGQTNPQVAKRIIDSVPGATGALIDSRDTHHCNPDGLAPNGLEQVFSIFDNAVQYRVGKRSIWLTIYQCVEGSGAIPYPNFHLFDSAYPQGFLRIEEDHPQADIGHRGIGRSNFSSRFYADRYLLIWSTEDRAMMLFDIETHKTIWKEFNLGRGDLLKEAFYSVEDQHVTQVNTDGSFYVYDVPGKKRVLEGRYVDDETIAWTPDLRFDASPEGANYVNLRFPGQRGQYAFQQFARTVKKPGLIAEVLARNYKPTDATLGLPPVLTGALHADAGRIKGEVTVSSAGDIRVYQDGLLTDTIPALQVGATIAVDVARIPGSRWVSVVAYDVAGLASLPVGSDLASVGDLPVLHALTIGIDRYEGAGLKPLGYAKKDAATLLTAIEVQNGKSLRLATRTHLADGEATPQAILAKVEAAVASAKRGETIVFSYAGHGVTGPDGRFYIATTNTVAHDIAGTALAWDRITALLSKAEARVIVFLDACHSGAAGTGMFATNDDAVGDVLQGVPSGLLVFSASKGRQFSEESSSTGGGVFTNAVADVIARKRAEFDLDRNGAIEISELYLGVKRQVANATEGRQVPWLARNELVGDFAIF